MEKRTIGVMRRRGLVMLFVSQPFYKRLELTLFVIPQSYLTNDVDLCMGSCESDPIKRWDPSRVDFSWDIPSFLWSFRSPDNP
jgi:hypothetical protein